jgi:hypothetical protein
MLTQVLSVGTALSIQSHPDKALAKKLHALRPDVRHLTARVLDGHRICFVFPAACCVNVPFFLL